MTPKTAILTKPIISKKTGAVLLPAGETVTIVHQYPTGGGEIIAQDGVVWCVSSKTMKGLLQ